MHDQDEEVTNQTNSSTSNKTEAHPAEASGKGRSAETARVLLRRAKRATRRRFSAEDKVRILLEGIRGEMAVAELCRREGIHPAAYYKWLKDFMEAGKSRMRGDSLREATSDEVQQLRQENERLKQLVADLSLNNMILKKSLS
jgi:transposase